MRVAYCLRVDVFDKTGGDLFQVKEYIRAGQQADCDGDPIFEGKIVTDIEADLVEFDIIHLVNIDRPVETYRFIRLARAAGKPAVISAIHHSYSEIERYERVGRGGVAGLFSSAMKFTTLESLRSIARSKTYPQLLRPALRMALRGVAKCQREILTGCKRIFVLTDKEKRDIVTDFHIPLSAPLYLLGNGLQSIADSEGSQNDAPREWDVCVVARVEARKNQIAILNALNRLNLRAVFAGGENKNHRAYCERFKRLIAGSGSKYLGEIPYEQIHTLMRSAKVHVSASWFEVSSLVDLEASLCGCFIVSSICGGTKEILGESAVYVDPGSEESITSGIAIAMERARSNIPAAKSLVKQRVPSWEEVGRLLHGQYQAVMAEHSSK